MRVRMDVSQPEFEWRWGSAGIHWLGSTHVLWQVQQEALTISLQAPCGSKRRRTTQTTSLRTTPIRSRVAGCYSQYMLKVARRMEVGSESRHSAAEASSPAVQDALRRSKSSRKARQLSLGFSNKRSAQTSTASAETVLAEEAVWPKPTSDDALARKQSAEAYRDWNRLLSAFHSSTPSPTSTRDGRPVSTLICLRIPAFVTVPASPSLFASSIPEHHLRLLDIQRTHSPPSKPTIPLSVFHGPSELATRPQLALL